MFCALDANLAHWHVEMDGADLNITAFTSHLSFCRLSCIPFGLHSALQAFQWTMEVISSPVKWQFCLVYLEDITIFSQMADKHIEIVRTELSMLHRPGVDWLQAGEMQVFRGKHDYLGRVIRPSRLGVASYNMNAMPDSKPPRAVTELKSLLGLCNVYGHFVPNFAWIDAPPTLTWK